MRFGRFLPETELDRATPVALLGPKLKQELFDQAQVTEIEATFTPGLPPATVAAGVKRLLRARHEGEEDFTVRTQGEVFDFLGRVFAVVSVAVGVIGILTMMWIGVGERTSEIGLL